MSKIAVIYWSQTGNTRAMAEAVVEGAQASGAEAVLLEVSDVSAADALTYDKLALGCPAMGAEVLEETEFEPFFTELEGNLSGRKVALFGSNGWGDGEWMREWQKRAAEAGADVFEGEGLILNEIPDEDGLARCRAFGSGFAAY